jgi:N-acetylmuramoyl-L-alanine amidase
MRFPASLFVALAAGATALPAQHRAIIVIDPGHGGDVAGSTADGLEEKDLVLRMSYILADQYLQEGFDVRLTRTGDYDIPFADRRIMAEEAGASLFVSLHLKRDDDPSAHGMEIYIDEANAASLEAGEAVTQALRRTGMPVLLEGRDWGFLASPTVPTVMIEAGFLTNPADQARIVSEEYHREFARYLVQATRHILETD